MEQLKNINLTSDLRANINELKMIYSDSVDMVYRSFKIANQVDAVIVYLDGMTNTELIDQSVLNSLMNAKQMNSIEDLLNHQLVTSNVKINQNLYECSMQISAGNAILLVEGDNQGYSLGMAKMEKRSIQEPSAESVVRGPREGFTEAIGVNMSLLRRRIKSPLLKMQAVVVGRYTQTNVVITYVEGLANKALIDEIKHRIARIDIDGIIDSYYIEELIKDSPYSLFPQLENTERPDVVAANLLEGRAAIIVDGSPFALIAPITFFSLLQGVEDYYQNFIFVTVLRWLRFFFLLISLLLPSIYIAVLTFHQEMVPTNLFNTIAQSRENLPFPALVEAFIMEIFFEALREAGTKMPKQIGSTISIVGALVIGDAATAAGIVSAPMVMVVAITGIASLMLPRYSAGIAIRLIRFPIMLFAGTLGLLGIILCLLILLIRLCSLRSFGVPFFSPLGPVNFQSMKDVLIRAPGWQYTTRPHFTGEYNKTRQRTPKMKPPDDKNNQ
ncbi:spore germination protein [Paenibacillus sp. N1-5-1-14]|uniref:spore germination protein n=1 Tax=Paenibacillus radicibacter TaxID=2972488 RepID=UPI0021591706|nr:spore germination protein [Paenibacillus radicibacter]MCR8643531.1 spore germination protein [Paenibacillus radicibacter]